MEEGIITFAVEGRVMLQTSEAYFSVSFKDFKRLWAI